MIDRCPYTSPKMVKTKDIMMKLMRITVMIMVIDDDSENNDDDGHNKRDDDDNDGI
jgi:hypothetical protein